MRVVINIEDEIYWRIAEDNSNGYGNNAIHAIRYGIPLPKGLGALTDKNTLAKRMIEYGWHHPDCTVHEFIEDDLPTIIEADKITIEIPNTGLEEDILRKGKWEDDSLFGRSLRNALMNFTKDSFCPDYVLDSIKSEIEVLSKTYPFINHIDTYVKEDDVKKIIDKYKQDKHTNLTNEELYQSFIKLEHENEILHDAIEAIKSILKGVDNE